MNSITFLSIFATTGNNDTPMGSDKSSCEINQQSLPLNELSSDATPRGPTSSSRSKASNTESSIQDTTPNTARSFTGID